jgi:hypothetical protein
MISLTELMGAMAMSHPKMNTVVGMAWECAAAHSHAI